MPLRYRIILLLKKNERVIFLILFILLLVACYWSIKTPSTNHVFTDEVMLSKRDSSNFIKEKEAETWQERDIKFTDTNKNLYRGNSTEEKKSVTGAVKNDRSNENFVQQSPRLNKFDKLEFETIHRGETKSDNSKKLPRSTSYPNEFLVIQEKEFGYLTITLENAHEYGYAYVAVDGNLWQQGEHNTTPLKIKLPVGNHRVEVKRDGFISSPVYTSIFIEKNLEKRVSFILIPEKNKLPGQG